MTKSNDQGAGARVIVGITGASGAVFGLAVLDALSAAGIETHLVVSKWGQQTLEHETGLGLGALRARADHYYGAGDFGAAISSGSFRVAGMVVVPCSMRSLAAIAHGMGENLVHRAADVMLKERRRLVLVPRETPFNEIHLENMMRLSRMGVIIMPPTPAFYNHPQSLDEMVENFARRVLDQFGIAPAHDARWKGEMRQAEKVVRLPDRDAD